MALKERDGENLSLEAWPWWTYDSGRKETPKCLDAFWEGRHAHMWDERHTHVL